jgi:transcriptional regulator with XRE-family HTH domain
MSPRLKDYRHQRGWTQRQTASVLGVTPNTVARWERGVLRLPAWVTSLLDAWTAAAAETHAAVDRAHALDVRLAQLHTTHAEQVKTLKWEITRLQLQNLALENRLKQKRQRQRQPRPRAAAGGGPAVKAEQVYKRLARRYHPDRNPAFAEVMTDINELWQATRR